MTVNLTPIAASKTALISRKLYTLGEDVWMPYSIDLQFTEEFRQKDGWYELLCIKDVWWLHLVKGFQWNGANSYPDWDFIKIPSARHDVNIWLIEHGVIPESMNNRVDIQLQEDVAASKTPIPFLQGGFLPRGIRARIIKRATHLHNARRKDGIIEHQLIYRRVVI